MAREVIIQIRLPVWSARRWFAVMAVACALGAGVVYAKVNWTPFVGGAKLTSQQLNDNFKSVADAVELLQAQPPPVLPHAVITNGNVDVGIYLGYYPGAYGSAYVVYSVAAKAPVLLGKVVELYFDGANCKGNAYTALNLGGDMPDFTNLAFETTKGTLFQKTAPTTLQNIGSLSWLDKMGVCQAQPQFINGLYPVKDMMVPNLNAGGAYTWSLQLK